MVRDADVEGDLNASAAPLVDLCSSLGIPSAALADVEKPAVLAHIFPVDAMNAARLDRAHVRSFVQHYGEAARLEIRTGDLTEIVIEPGIGDHVVEAFARTAASGGPYEAVVTVDKQRLTKRIAGPTPARTVQVFLFAAALRKALERGLARFEEEVWSHAPAPMVIGLLDTDVNLRGDHLSVIGGAWLQEVRNAAADPPSVLDVEGIVASRDMHVGWNTRWVRALTPWHFRVTGTCADVALDGLLRAQVVKLAVLFTCDRARIRPLGALPGEILAEYRGREHVAIVPIDEGTPLQCSDAETAAIVHAVDWCYQSRGTAGQPDWVSDRLAFLQTRVAQALEPHPAPDRLSIFATAMPYLFEGIKWHWKAFIEGKVGEYLDRVQQIENVVSDTVSTFADRTASLTKGLTDNILAAVAVLVASFIAAAVRTPFNPTLFRVGVLSYGVYVLIFPGAIGLFASASSLGRARTDFDARIKTFNETLYPEKVADIVDGRVDSAQSTYHRWLGFVGAVYLAVAIACGVASAVVPGVIRGNASKPKHAVAVAWSCPMAELRPARSGAVAIRDQDPLIKRRPTLAATGRRVPVRNDCVDLR